MIRFVRLTPVCRWRSLATLVCVTLGTWVTLCCVNTPEALATRDELGEWIGQHNGYRLASPLLSWGKYEAEGAEQTGEEKGLADANRGKIKPVQPPSERTGQLLWHHTKTALIVASFVAPAAIWNDQTWVRYYGMTTATLGGACLGIMLGVNAAESRSRSLSLMAEVGLLGLIVGGVGGWFLSNWSTSNDGIGRPLTVGFSFTPYVVSRIINARELR
jgi:hypothetical protein